MTETTGTTGTTGTTAELHEDRVTGFRVIARNNYSRRNEQNLIVNAGSGADQGTFAIALDSACTEAIRRRGNSGLGAGAYVEMVFNDDDPEDKETVGKTVETLSHPLISVLPLVGQGSSIQSLRQAIGSAKRRTVWDGHNHVPQSYVYAATILEAAHKAAV